MNSLKVVILKCAQDSAFMGSYGGLVSEYLYTQARLEQLENNFRVRVGSVPQRKWGRLFSAWNVRVAIFGLGKRKQEAPPPPVRRAPALEDPTLNVFDVSEPKPRAPQQQPAPQAPQQSAPQQSAPQQSAPQAPQQSAKPQQQKSEDDPRNIKKTDEEKKKKITDAMKSYTDATSGSEQKAALFRIKGFFNTPSLKKLLDKMTKKWEEQKSKAKVDKSTGQISTDGVSVSTLKKKYPEAYKQFVTRYWVYNLGKALFQYAEHIGDKTEYEDNGVRRKKKSPTEQGGELTPQQKQQQDRERLVEFMSESGYDLGGGSVQDQFAVAVGIQEESEEQEIPSFDANDFDQMEDNLRAVGWLS